MNKRNCFFMNKDNEKYNELCEKCPYDCKQSFRAEVLTCKFIKEQEKENGRKRKK